MQPKIWQTEADFRRQATVEGSFSYLREQIEAAHVYVLLLGNLGSHHTNIPADIFRGFAVADAIAPFLVINDQYARAAWSFTALHEVAHLWLGTTGVSGASVETHIERYCNDVAGEILLPTAEVRTLANLRRAPFASIVEAVTTFATARKISRAMVAYTMFRADAITGATWSQVTDHLRREWIASGMKDEVDTGGGPGYTF